MSIVLRAPRNPEEFQACLSLRWQILRQPWGQPPGSEQDSEEPSAHHLMAIDENDRVVGVGRIHEVEPGTGQIRYMAVSPDMRGQGLGARIAHGLEAIARREGWRRIVLNARQDAVSFYTRLGFSPLGPGPLLFETIHHTRMEKNLTESHSGEHMHG